MIKAIKMMLKGKKSPLIIINDKANDRWKLLPRLMVTIKSAKFFS